MYYLIQRSNHGMFISLTNKWFKVICSAITEGRFLYGQMNKQISPTTNGSCYIWCSVSEQQDNGSLTQHKTAYVQIPNPCNFSGCKWQNSKERYLVPHIKQHVCISFWKKTLSWGSKNKCKKKLIWCLVTWLEKGISHNSLASSLPFVSKTLTE